MNRSFLLLGLIYQNDLTEKVALLSMATIGTRLLVHSKRLTPWRHPLYIYSTGVGKIMPCTEHLQCAIWACAICSRFQLYFPLDGAEPSPYPPHLILKYCSVLYQRSGDCIGPSLSGTKNKKKSDLNLLPKCFIMLKKSKEKSTRRLYCHICNVPKLKTVTLFNLHAECYKKNKRWGLKKDSALPWG